MSIFYILMRLTRSSEVTASDLLPSNLFALKIAFLSQSVQYIQSSNNVILNGCFSFSGEYKMTLKFQMNENKENIKERKNELVVYQPNFLKYSSYFHLLFAPSKSDDPIKFNLASIQYTRSITRSNVNPLGHLTVSEIIVCR